jgi:hypothetical protein
MIELSHKNQIDWSDTRVKIKDADFANPFESIVEYSSPARGPWNIVHTGMLMPESHQIFVCAQSCLRGVVLTAAEMGAEERFSMITIQEHNVLDGDMEKLIINGVADIVLKLPVRPRAILLFTSCIHHFIGCDLKFVYDKLHENFPDIDITDCYMNPTMRKTLTPPDIKTRQQLYSVLHQSDVRDNGINFIGNNFATDINGDFGIIFRKAGCVSGDGSPLVRDVCTSRTYDEFQEMAKSRLNITTNPAAILAGDTLQYRFGTKHLHLPLCYDFDEIDNCILRLCEELSCSCEHDISILRDKATDALAQTSSLVGSTPISIDYTSTSRPLGLAKLLLSHHMNVVSVYADSFIPQEKESFDWLKAHAPDLEIYATIHPKMAIMPACTNGICAHSLYEDLVPPPLPEQKHMTIAIGQKAAYFTNTTHFVNMIEGNGLWGYYGIISLMALIVDAYRNQKDTAKIIQVKGWGSKA